MASDVNTEQRENGRRTSHGTRTTGASFTSVPGGRSADASRPRGSSGRPVRRNTDAPRANRTGRQAVQRRRADDEARSSKRSASANWDSVRPKQRDNRLLAFVGNHTKLVVALLVVIALGTLVYPAARDYYLSTRKLDEATLELAAVREHNQELQHNIDRISTDEGIEDYVREQYGWVKVGETPAVVKGLSDGSSAEMVDEEVDLDEIEPESSWVTDFLDLFFLAGEK